MATSPENKLALKHKREERTWEPSASDLFQTPPEALAPLIPLLKPNSIIWECASGAGFLVRELESHGFQVIATDIEDGFNFFDYRPATFDYIITNPPYTIKVRWLERCYNLQKPFALLLPVETLGVVRAQRLFSQYGVEVVLLNRRVNFINLKNPCLSGAWFSVAWFTWGLNIGHQLTFACLPKLSSSSHLYHRKLI